MALPVPFKRHPTGRQISAQAWLKRYSGTTGRPPTLKMIEVLREIAAGLGTGHGLKTMADHGGRHAVVCGLLRRGLINKDRELTEAGRALVAEAAKPDRKPAS